MPEKTDIEQLQGILKEFDLGDVAEVLSDLRADMMPSVTGFKDLGERCAPGEDGFITREVFPEGLEAVWDDFNLLPAHFLTEGAEVQKSVAMVTLKVAMGSLSPGDGWGSGFLVSNSLFMTNNHVIESKAFCDKVNMQFMYQDNYDSQPAINSEFFETNEDSFFHTNSALDYTIVRLARKPYQLVARYPWESAQLEASESTEEYADDGQLTELKTLSDVIARKAPISAFDPSRFLMFFGYTPGSKYGFLRLRPAISYPQGLRLNIVQHPQGRKKEVVVQQNELKHVHTNVIHYFSDTDYGSSGSPVCDNRWDLMALHHARKVSESANEGIRIDKIVADLRNEFSSSNPAILNELGIIIIGGG